MLCGGAATFACLGCSTCWLNEEPMTYWKSSSSLASTLKEADMPGDLRVIDNARQEIAYILDFCRMFLPRTVMKSGVQECSASCIQRDENDHIGICRHDASVQPYCSLTTWKKDCIACVCVCHVVSRKGGDEGMKLGCAKDA